MLEYVSLMRFYTKYVFWLVFDIEATSSKIHFHNRIDAIISVDNLGTLQATIAIQWGSWSIQFFVSYKDYHSWVIFIVSCMTEDAVWIVWLIKHFELVLFIKDNYPNVGFLSQRCNVFSTSSVHKLKEVRKHWNKVSDICFTSTLCEKEATERLTWQNNLHPI